MGFRFRNPVRAVVSAVARVAQPVARANTGFRKLAGSAATSPFRAANNARLAAARGQSVRGAVSQTRIGNTSVLKVGRVGAVVAATAATAGAVGAAVGVSGLGSAAGAAMATTGGVQLATQGRLDERGLARAGFNGAKDAITGKVPGVDTYRKVKNLKATIDGMREQKRQRELDRKQQQELAQLEAEYARELARVAQEQKAERTGEAAPQPEQKKAGLFQALIGGAAALKLIALLE